jgi:hypothetical protein
MRYFILQLLRLLLFYLLASAAVSSVVTSIDYIQRDRSREMAFVGFGLSPVFCVLAYLALRSFRRRRAVKRLELDGGLFERWAESSPGVFGTVSRIQIKGFGMCLLDHHEPQPDGSHFATLWITVAFMPVAPVARLRIRNFEEKEKNLIPLVLSWTSSKYDVLERLPVSHERSGRVYRYYYLFFLPLLFLPFLGAIAWVIIARKRQIPYADTLFWILMGAAFVWAFFLLWLEERRMKTPPSIQKQQAK